MTARYEAESQPRYIQLLFRVSGVHRRIVPIYRLSWATAVAQWLRCCATYRKVAGSIPAGVTGFFIDIKSFRSHYGPLTEMSTRSISWG